MFEGNYIHRTASAPVLQAARLYTGDRGTGGIEPPREEPDMELGALDHVAIRVEDPEALHEFLTEVLGLERRGTATRGLYALAGGVTLAVFRVGTEEGGQGERHR